MISEEETKQTTEEFLAWRHQNLTRQPPERTRYDKDNKAAMVKIDAKLSEMSDEKFIAEMMGVE
jgi:hypothetical protein